MPHRLPHQISTAEMLEDGERLVAMWARRVTSDARFNYPGASGSVEAKLDWAQRVHEEEMEVTAGDVVGFVQWAACPAEVAVEVCANRDDLPDARDTDGPIVCVRWHRFPKGTPIADVQEVCVRSLGVTSAKARVAAQSHHVMGGATLGECLWSGPDPTIRVLVEVTPPANQWQAELALYENYVKKASVYVDAYAAIFVPLKWRTEQQRVWAHVIRGLDEAQCIKKALLTERCPALRRSILDRELDASATKTELQDRFVTTLAITWIVYRYPSDVWHDDHAPAFLRNLAHAWRRDILATPHNVAHLDLGACLVGPHDARASLLALVDLLAGLHHRFGSDFNALPRNQKALTAAIGILTPRTHHAYHREV